MMCTMYQGLHNPTTSLLSRQAKHGQKRKGKPMEAWMIMDLERNAAQEIEERCTQNLDMNAIQRIADGVEQMVFSWDSEKKDRDRVSKSLENFGSGMKEDDNVHVHESEDCVVPQERHHASVHKNGLPYNEGCKHDTGSGKRKGERLWPLLRCVNHRLGSEHEHEPYRLRNSRDRERERRREGTGCHDVSFHQDSVGGTVLEVRGQSGGYLQIATGEQLFTAEKKMRKTEEGVVQGRKGAKDTSLQLTVRGPLTLQDEQQSATMSPCQGSLPSTHHSTLSQACTDVPIYSSGEAPVDGYSVSMPRCYTGIEQKKQTEMSEVGHHSIQMPVPQGSDKMLENKFWSLLHLSPCISIIQEKECPWSAPPAILDAGELQIALLECAMEYELKTIETKIKMQELKFHGQEIEHQKLEQQPCVEKFAEQQGDLQQISLHRLRKQMMKLQDEKGALSKELSTLRTRERKFDKQQHTLDDALHHVNHLQRELLKKQQEVVECQLKQKEEQAHLQDLEEKLKRTHIVHTSQRLEPCKLLTLLPALREWLHSLRKDIDEEHSFPHLITHYVKPLSALPIKDRNYQGHLGPLGHLSEQLEQQADVKLSVAQVDVIICCLTKEIQALQNELINLARC